MKRFGTSIKILGLKLFALLSVIRGYNLFLLVLAQYFASLFIFSRRPYRETLLDLHLFLLIFASTCLIAAAYIINDFYDAEKDWVNRPHQRSLNEHISQRFKLNVYMFFNTLALAVAMVLSYRVFAFFVWYAALLWLYSHKLKKLTLVANFTAALLSVIPFFPLFFYYSRFDGLIFTYAAFLYLLLLARDLAKDFTGIHGDLIYDYPTLPVALGVSRAKRIVGFALVLTAVLAGLLAGVFPTGAMRYYFYLYLIAMGVSAVVLYRARSQRQFHVLHNLLRALLVLGIFSILLVTG